MAHATATGSVTIMSVTPERRQNLDTGFNVLLLAIMIFVLVAAVMSKPWSRNVSIDGRDLTGNVVIHTSDDVTVETQIVGATKTITIKARETTHANRSR